MTKYQESVFLQLSSPAEAYILWPTVLEELGYSLINWAWIESEINLPIASLKCGCTMK